MDPLGQINSPSGTGLGTTPPGGEKWGATRWLLGFLAVLWIIELVDLAVTFATPWKLDSFGIYPRTLHGFFKIPLAPLLHGGFGHLISNSIPLFVLGWLAARGGLATLWRVTVLSALIGGLGTWLLGSSSYHIGASGVVFGYLGFCLSVGFFTKKIPWILIGVVAGVLYGGVALTLFRPEAGISWSGHAFGLLGGVYAAWRMGAPLRGRLTGGPGMLG